ncbi:uncharacterized protein LOC127256372 [Andrographis paniculata]|uniref:uncharacterized protein LOC127256372 n=1 Tax=Andrographis paniculata TaxID=175694 RepID=UPI0021E9769D|nr:uncharacterized protein LOC127256372 [Andrographis paniculata]
MAAPPRRRVRISVDSASFVCAVILTALILTTMSAVVVINGGGGVEAVRGRRMAERSCEEIYVVGEGETLQTIGEKCGDPYIVERNPHIHDPDDVFPGLVMRILPRPIYNSHRF